MSPRILVVDDQGKIARLVRPSLEQDGCEVLVANDGETALQMLRREWPDLVLLDLLAPEGDGGGVAHGMQPGINLTAMPIVQLATQAGDREATEGLPASSQVDANPGPVGDATLPLNPQDIVARVRAILHRLQVEPTPPKVVQVQALAIDLVARRAEVRGRSLHLTPIEFALLRALAERPGQALSRCAMIKNGPGLSYDGRERTVDSHVKNLRHKLQEAAGAAHLIETVFGVGYRLATGDEE